MEKIAGKLTRYLFKHGAITQEDCAIYEYGLQTGLEMSMCVMTCAILALFMHMFMEFLIFTIAFALLRSYVVGIHMKRFLSCFFCSVATVIMSLFIVNRFSFCNLFSYGVLLILFILLDYVSLETMQQFDEREQKYYTTQRRRVLAGIGLVTFVFLVFHMEKVYMIIVLATMVTFVSVVTNKKLSSK